jgi:hypothetical protein
MHADKRFTWDSESGLNHLFSLSRGDPRFDEWAQQWAKMRRASYDEGGAVKFLKARLGRQKFCWQGPSVRNWVWEGDDWRAFASTRGVSFELRVGLTTEQALAAWHDFMRKVGLT